VNLPTWIDTLPPSALYQLPLSYRREVCEVVGARTGDDGVPDYGLVGRVVRASRVGPLGRHVDEDLLRVPGEERAEVGVEAELYDGVFFFLGRVIVWAAADSETYSVRGAIKVEWGRWLLRIDGGLHLDVCCLQCPAWYSWSQEVGSCYECRDGEGDCGEEPKGVLHPYQRGVHGGQAEG
jgi:hypothetical protein